jgi:hypothetical protein
MAVNVSLAVGRSNFFSPQVKSDEIQMNAEFKIQSTQRMQGLSSLRILHSDFRISFPSVFI